MRNWMGLIIIFLGGVLIEIIYAWIKNRSEEKDKKLTQNQLISKYENTRSADKRKELVRRISDKEYLAGIAMNNSDSGVRSAAVDKIDDQKVLAEIAEKDPYALSRLSAVKKLTDQAVLKRIVFNDSENFVRSEAAKRITDPELLKELVLRKRDDQVAYGAALAIEDRAFLERLLMSEDISKAVRQGVFRRLKELPGQTRLTPGCWVFSCYDRTRVAGLMLANPSFYEAENVIRLFREAYSIAPDVKVVHVKAEDWDAPGITATETGFDWNIDEVDAKKNQYLVSHCGFSEQQASMTKWTTLAYPNAGLLLVIVNFWLDV